MSSNLENALQEINRKKIKLDDKIVKQNNELLLEFMDSFIVEFRKDVFFKSIYERFFSGGSFYDGLKIAKPNEFDIDVLFVLPVIASPKVMCDDNYPGYVQVQMPTLKNLLKADYNPSYKDMTKNLVNEDDYLSIPKIMSWFQRMVATAMNSFNSTKFKIIKTSPKQTGPAVTFKIQDKSRYEEIDIDFVPCFKFFSKKHWPKNIRVVPYFSNENEDQLIREFLVVPKQKDRFNDTYLRLSFQGQERRIITNRGHLKPAIRLLKLYRDNYNDAKIKSYFLKTLALWALNDSNFCYENESLNSIFLQLFKKLITVVGNRDLQYYWNKDFNLLLECDRIYLQHLLHRLQKHLLIFKNGDYDKVMKTFMVCASEDELNRPFQFTQ